MPPFEEYIEEIRELWDTKCLTNMGDKHNQLEKQIKDYLMTDHVSLFSNGHLALENVIAAMNLKGEVITTPFTFVSTTHAITRNGLTPVFCDINENDYTIDVDQIERLITKDTSAIIPVHVYGHICDTEAIEKIARQYNLKVIYDAAHAFAEKKDGIGVANFGDASIFSFHATKVFNTIEGGAVTYRDSFLDTKLYELKNFGITGYEKIAAVGMNAKMNEFQAAMGICNLRHLSEEISKRKKIYEIYTLRLRDIEGIHINEISNNMESNYSYYPVLFDTYKKNRDEIFEILKGNDILSRKYFYPLTNNCDAYNYKCDTTPVAKYVSDHILCLPIYAELSYNDVNNICDIILGK